jgi:hypothetical protein
MRPDPDQGRHMSEVNNHLFDTIDRQNSHESAHTRRTLVATTAAALGSMGLLGFASKDAFGSVKTSSANSVKNITTVAATAEVLATIVNTVGPEKLGNRLDAVTQRNIRAAAQQEKNHYELLTSKAVGGKAATKTIHAPTRSSPRRRPCSRQTRSLPRRPSDCRASALWTDSTAMISAV